MSTVYRISGLAENALFFSVEPCPFDKTLCPNPNEACQQQFAHKLCSISRGSGCRQADAKHRGAGLVRCRSECRRSVCQPTQSSES